MIEAQYVENNYRYNSDIAINRLLAYENALSRSRSEGTTLSQGLR